MRKKSLGLVIVFSLIICGWAGCSSKKEYEVLSTTPLEKVPLLVKNSETLTAYQKNDLLLGLVNMAVGRVRVYRGKCDVLAIFNSETHQWRVPAGADVVLLNSMDYRIADQVDIKASGLKLSRGLGPKIPLATADGAAGWLRAGYHHPNVNLEVGFNTQPLTIRKVTYRPAANGLYATLEEGALIKVK